MKLIRVALPSPLRRLFDYRLPAALSAPEGVRVEVPFASRRLIGVVVAELEQSDQPEEKLKAVIRVLDETPLLPDQTLALCRWAASYYQHSLGETLQQALPALLRKGEAAAFGQQRYWRALSPPDEAVRHQLRRAFKQLEALEALAQHPQGLSQAMLDKLGIAASHLKALAERGLAEAFEREQAPTRFDGPVLASAALTLNAEQQQAVAAITAALGGFQPFLLDGVTGSGKTEVYLQLIERCLEQGRQALVLVPEIGLTPQTLNRFRQRFAVPVALTHSGLNDRERLHSWLQASRGLAGILIGTRSAIFTPMPRLGLVIVDEEHDASYKQQDSLRYSARDLAVFRARQAGVPVVLGSATPTLESLANVEAGRYRYLPLRERAGGAQPPRLELLDLRTEPLAEGLAQTTVTRIGAHLARGQQVLVFLNRRGFAPALACNHCGWIADCPHCDAHLTLHLRPPHLHCHHCDHELPLPTRCPQCRQAGLAPVGQGTERSEQYLANLFPKVPVIRVDRDSTSRKEAMQRLLAPVLAGEPCILVGTQMLAKGHHFPGVTLVVILNADGGLFSADFRGAEKTGQLILQVAGRAGRAERSGEVLIQSYYPEHEILQRLVTEGYGPFAQRLLAERRSLQLPPYRHLALLRAEAAQLAEAEGLLRQCRGFLGEWLNAHRLGGPDGIQPVGPMAAPMERRQGRYRALLLIQAAARGPLHQCLQALCAWLEALPEARRVRWSLDVDPQELN